MTKATAGERALVLRDLFLEKNWRVGGPNKILNIAWIVVTSQTAGAIIDVWEDGSIWIRGTSGPRPQGRSEAEAVLRGAGLGEYLR
jgi:hypothetical protein